MALLLGIDLGTSYFKVGVFDPTGELKGLGRVAVAKTRPAPGRVELPVEAFWALLRRALADALAQAGAGAGEIAAVSYSSQANTFVLLDAADAPLTPLVLWTDTRAGEVPAEWARLGASPAYQRTIGFSGPSAQSAVTKWQWYRREHPALWAKVRRALTVSDYFTYALTGEAVGDASTAALLGLYDLRGGGWWQDALDAFDVDATRLAHPVPPGTPVGWTTEAATRWLGLPAGRPFAVGGLDHHVAALGAGLDVFADVSISTGTVLAAICLVDDVQPASGCFHGPHLDGRRFYRLAFDPAGAGQLEELQRRFAPASTLEELIAAAVREPAGSRPAAARWTVEWGREPARAMRELLDTIAATQRALVLTATGGHVPRQISATGGGARSGAWLEIKAGVIGAPIVTPACPERACLGAAVFAAAAGRLYPDVGTAARAMVRPERTFAPAG